MRSSNLVETLKALYAIKRAVCIEGPPGGGKTSIVRQVASELGVQYIERHMPTMLVEDFGIPVPSDGVLRYQIPEWFPTDPNSEGILCFDDRNQANADLQKVLANIIQARNLHGVPLPKGWMVVSTGNRQSDRAGAVRVLSHLRNRESVVELDTAVDDWTKWASENGVKTEVIAFITYRPNLLHDFDPSKDANPTPRSWVDGVSSVLGVVPRYAETELFKGAVGEGPAMEFVGFLRIYRELDDPAKIIQNPDGYLIPESPAVRYALIISMQNVVSVTNVDNVVRFIRRFPAEFIVLWLRQVMAADKAKINTRERVLNTPAFQKLVIDYQSIMLGQ